MEAAVKGSEVAAVKGREVAAVGEVREVEGWVEVGELVEGVWEVVTWVEVRVVGWVVVRVVGALVGVGLAKMLVVGILRVAAEETLEEEGVLMDLQRTVKLGLAEEGKVGWVVDWVVGALVGVGLAKMLVVEILQVAAEETLEEEGVLMDLQRTVKLGLAEEGKVGWVVDWVVGALVGVGLAKMLVVEILQVAAEETLEEEGVLMDLQRTVKLGLAEEGKVEVKGTQEVLEADMGGEAREVKGVEVALEVVEGLGVAMADLQRVEGAMRVVAQGEMEVELQEEVKGVVSQTGLEVDLAKEEVVEGVLVGLLVGVGLDQAEEERVVGFLGEGPVVVEAWVADFPGEAKVGGLAGEGRVVLEEGVADFLGEGKVVDLAGEGKVVVEAWVADFLGERKVGDSAGEGRVGWEEVVADFLGEERVVD